MAVAPRGITVNALCPGWVDTDMAHQRYVELGIEAGGFRRADRTVAAPPRSPTRCLVAAARGAITGHALR